jgi:hypothetical protein
VDVIRKIIWTKRNKATGKWGRLHNEELYAMYSSPNIIQVIKSRRPRSAGHIASMRGDRRGACRILVGIPEGKRPLRLCRWEDIIKMDIQKVGCRGLDWICLASDRDG